MPDSRFILCDGSDLGECLGCFRLPTVISGPFSALVIHPWMPWPPLNASTPASAFFGLLDGPEDKARRMACSVPTHGVACLVLTGRR